MKQFKYYVALLLLLSIVSFLFVQNFLHNPTHEVVTSIVNHKAISSGVKTEKVKDYISGEIIENVQDTNLDIIKGQYPDAASFEPLFFNGEATPYSKDKNHVYIKNGQVSSWLVLLPDIDPQSFHFFFRKSKQCDITVHMFGDCADAFPTQIDFAKDKNHIYFMVNYTGWVSVLKNVDQNSFELTSEPIPDKDGYYIMAKDKSGSYKITGAGATRVID